MLIRMTQIPTDLNEVGIILGLVTNDILIYCTRKIFEKCRQQKLLI